MGDKNGVSSWRRRVVLYGHLFFQTHLTCACSYANTCDSLLVLPAHKRQWWFWMGLKHSGIVSVLLLSSLTRAAHKHKIKRWFTILEALRCSSWQMRSSRPWGESTGQNSATIPDKRFIQEFILGDRETGASLRSVLIAVTLAVMVDNDLFTEMVNT